MTETYVYDKAKWHYGGDFPADLEPEQAFVHTGMFLGWIIEHNLYSELFESELRGCIAAFRTREMTGPKVFEACDGCLMDDMLNSEGNAFAHDYFDFDRGKFLSDYGESLAKGLPTIYHVADTWPNYEKIRKRIDKRYLEWKSGSPRGWRSFFRKRP